MASVLQGKQATIRVVHDQLDPIQQTAIGFATKLAVDEVNSAILAQIVGAGQTGHPTARTGPSGDPRGVATARARPCRAPIRRRSSAAAADLRQPAAQADTVVTATASFLAELRGDAAGAQAGLLDQAHAALIDLQSSAQTVEAGSRPRQPGRCGQDASRPSTSVDAMLGQLQAVDPAVLVAPFTGEAEVAVAKPVGITDYYAPGAIVLLIQHLGVTFGALSFVRDRAARPLRDAPRRAGHHGPDAASGSTAPTGSSAPWSPRRSAGSSCAGLNVPLAGQVWWVAVVLGLVLLASLGIGFFISLLAKSDSQAVQFAMIVLLASLFFGGFFLSLNQLTFPVELDLVRAAGALRHQRPAGRDAARHGAIRRRHRRPRQHRRARLRLGVVRPSPPAARGVGIVQPAPSLRRPLGVALLVAATIVGLGAIVGTVVAWIAIGDAQRSSRHALELADEALVSVDSSLAVASDVDGPGPCRCRGDVGRALRRRRCTRRRRRRARARSSSSWTPCPARCRASSARCTPERRRRRDRPDLDRHLTSAR